MNNLERSISLASAGRHNEKNAVLPTGNRINGAVDGDALIVARDLITRLEIVRLGNKLLLLRREMFVADVPLPEIMRRGKLLQRQFTLFAGFYIVFQETVAI